MQEIVKRDYLINFAVIGLLIASLTALFHATMDMPGSDFFIKQVFYMILGGIVALVLSKCDYRFLAKHAPILYVCGIVFLMSVFVLGKKVNGALSWIDLGILNIQPSEVTRITTLLLLARFYEQNKGHFIKTKDLAKTAVVLIIPTGLVLVQPDLGMALIYFSMLGCFLILTRLAKWVPITAIAGACIVGISLYILYVISPTAFFEVVRPHQFERLTSFMHPEDDPLGAGYQYIQARKIVGSGQLTGAGILYMLASKAGKLPEKHTDFIFATIAHQWGFIGASLLLMLYFLLFYRLVHWAMKTPDPFASFFISGMVTMWVFQVFVNIGMNIGLSPITGLTLPFISYGGSSLLSNMIALGIIFSMREVSPLLELE
ncbi:FtsW/RodA/SpoVE family cell cycle protein [Brevibacillus dissolubilis]|uniref:FtsW/RodA/SpoVE family cell cycle protein n=1 Tax=Brevibacillus dissolubilis TaxID=1844116 RepID=UPI001115B425|nr:FtsW/RodA/SpoVE family cell cycle protein [Brevibacillus dissolubilis]